MAGFGNMSPAQAARGSRAGAVLCGTVVALGLRLLGLTWKLRTAGEEHERAARGASPRVIYALGHGRMLALAFAYRGRGIRALVSRHRDGEILAHALRSLGYVPLRGSSRRGGAEAAFALLAEARRSDLAITPDGPRGPSGEVAPGILFVARRTGLPIVPVGLSASSAWRLGTWDRFLLPRPFARVTIRVGEPLWAEPERASGSLGALGAELGRRLERLSAPQTDEPRSAPGRA